MVNALGQPRAKIMHTWRAHEECNNISSYTSSFVDHIEVEDYEQCKADVELEVGEQTQFKLDTRSRIIPQLYTWQRVHEVALRHCTNNSTNDVVLKMRPDTIVTIDRGVFEKVKQSIIENPMLFYSIVPYSWCPSQHEQFKTNKVSDLTFITSKHFFDYIAKTNVYKIVHNRFSSMTDAAEYYALCPEMIVYSLVKDGGFDIRYLSPQEAAVQIFRDGVSHHW
jgi:hypothetical protein